MADIISSHNLLLAKANPNEGTKGVQAPNQDAQENSKGPSKKIPKSSKLSLPKNKRVSSLENSNLDNNGIRDETASSSGGNKPDKRTRKHRSSKASVTKDVSTKKSKRKKEILGDELSLHKVLVDAVTKYKETNGRYNGIIRLMNPQLLRTCYSLIMSNPGNMTLGTSKETLDGIKEKWFDITARDMLEGRFGFSPTRRVLIPKPNKPNQFRQLMIANPREKIVQKAIQVVLNAIFEQMFCDSSYGFRLGRSILTALDKIHMRAGQLA